MTKNPFEDDKSKDAKGEKTTEVVNPFSPESRAHLTAEQEKPKGFKPRKTFRSKNNPPFELLRKDANERMMAQQQAEHEAHVAQQEQMTKAVDSKRKER